MLDISTENHSHTVLTYALLRITVKTRAEKGRAVKGQSALGPMCDAAKDWHERYFRASGAINGCQKSPLNKPEMTFSFFIFK